MSQLDREEYIEQAYFFRNVRERLETNRPTQEVLDRIHEEILSTTRLPMAIQFLATELKHAGQLSSGFKRLAHYFTAFQAFVVEQTENDKKRFSLESALQILEREAKYRAGEPTQRGLFVFEFEVLCRHRLGYDDGLVAMAHDSYFDDAWRDYFSLVRRQAGVVDFADLIYLRSEWYVAEQRRIDPAFEPSQPPLFGEKEGKIAKANRGRDPLYLFAALQRQLNYPEVPRPVPADDTRSLVITLQAKMREMETRLKLVEGETRGDVDLSKFGRPDLLSADNEIEL